MRCVFSLFLLISIPAFSEHLGGYGYGGYPSYSGGAPGGLGSYANACGPRAYGGGYGGGANNYYSPPALVSPSTPPPQGLSPWSEGGPAAGGTASQQAAGQSAGAAQAAGGGGAVNVTTELGQRCNGCHRSPKPIGALVAKIKGSEFNLAAVQDKGPGMKAAIEAVVANPELMAAIRNWTGAQ